MPFVLTPVLWGKVAGHFYKKNQKKERSHGDGLLVSEDSPEAFEEILWKKFFSKKYSKDRITPWLKEDLKYKFKEYFSDHMRKMISIRLEPELQNKRYISKNDANIARVDIIHEMFPDAQIIVPVRHPVEHAISLYRQHLNYIKQHADNKFVYEYMCDIGHYEFGTLHRPIDFDGINDLLREYLPTSINYWLKYWIITFEYLIKKQGISFISYEDLCTSGETGLSKLNNYLGLHSSSEDISKAASIYRTPPTPRQRDYDISKELVDSAIKLHSALSQHCLLKK